MQKILSGLAVFTLFLCAGSSLAQTEKELPVPPYSLKDLYDLTIDRSENLKIRDQEIVIAEQRYREAISAVYPNLSLELQHRRVDNANFGRVNRGRTTIDDPATPIGGSGGILGRTQAGAIVSVTQPIFNGFREFLLADAASVETEAQRLEAKRSRELLYLDVADLYHQIIFAEDELKVLTQSETTFNDRVKELKGFIQLGKSRESEVLASMSDLADLEATAEQIKGLRKASLELMAFLTGVPAAELKLEREKKAPALKPLDDYLLQGPLRNDLLASKQRIGAQEKRVTAARREHWPSLDLLGNGYGLEDPDRNREWELIFQITVPIFEGGRIDARTAQEESRLRIAELAAAEKARLIERDIRVAYVNTTSARDELQSLRKLRETADRNYKLQKVDYSNGVVTNLEVLQAIRQLQEADRRLVRAEQAYYTNFVDLVVASGGVPE